VFALTCLEDLPLDRIAQILEISDLTAKTHLQRARAALREQLRPAEPVPPARPAPRIPSVQSVQEAP
jgi:DNA-directed RNA polymerase specialized sigma24 family protein